MPQLRVWMLQLKTPRATIKTQHSQTKLINIIISYKTTDMKLTISITFIQYFCWVSEVCQTLALTGHFLQSNKISKLNKAGFHPFLPVWGRTWVSCPWIRRYTICSPGSQVFEFWLKLFLGFPCGSLDFQVVELLNLHKHMSQILILISFCMYLCVCSPIASLGLKDNPPFWVSRFSFLYDSRCSYGFVHTLTWQN